MKKLFLLTVLAFSVINIHAAIVNVEDFGAKGNDNVDDTAAIQSAINKASTMSKGGILYFPAGRYFISKTLKIESAHGLIVRGEGSLGYKAEYLSGKATQSVLIWNGDDDGILLHSTGAFSNRYENLAFAGKKNDANKNQAGILFLLTSKKNSGNMIHSFSNLSFSHAKVGIQMGSEDSINICNSDMVFEAIYFGSLDSGFKTYNSQAVDYTFSFVFGLNVKTVFDFQAGGNLLVNTAQLTCSNFLKIGKGGSTCNTYMLNNVRLEGNSSAKKNGLRYYALKTSPELASALIKFNSFCDAQWYWSIQKPHPQQPLFDLGPGAYLVIENSIFHGPVASLAGTNTKNSRLKICDSIFKFIVPENAVKVKPKGFFKLIDNCDNNLKLFPDKVKWN